MQKDTLLRGEKCVISHFWPPKADAEMQKNTLLHPKKCAFWHFCVPSGRPQISRNPMNSLPILRFCDFLESVVFALACARFRMPARTRTREVRARERELPTFPKSQNREMRQENIGVGENPSRREGTKKCKRHTFEMQKVCISHLWAPQGGRQNAKQHTFASQKVCLLALLRPIRATANLTKPFVFLAHFAIL